MLLSTRKINLERDMLKSFLYTSLGVFLERWLDGQKNKKRMASVRRKGVHPLVAVGGLIFGTLIGALVGFLYTPKGKDYVPPEE
jgi:hypothetical protein